MVMGEEVPFTNAHSGSFCPFILTRPSTFALALRLHTGIYFSHENTMVPATNGWQLCSAHPGECADRTEAPYWNNRSSELHGEGQLPLPVIEGPIAVSDLPPATWSPTAPTASPSVSPTSSNPTATPTARPTVAQPTLSPSASPTTSTPTGSPSIAPTVSVPTASPSISPTSSDHPSLAPTASPTARPTATATVTATATATIPGSANILSSDKMKDDSSVLVLVMGLVIAGLVVVVGAMGYRMHHRPEGSTVTRSNNMHSNPTCVRSECPLPPLPIIFVCLIILYDHLLFLCAYIRPLNFVCA